MDIREIPPLPSPLLFLEIAALLYRLADAARQRRRARSATVAQAHGRLGEDLAHRFLRKQGVTIVARNFHARAGRGEIDLIARHGETLVFVEVKTRASAAYGSPDRAVGLDKERDLRHAASEYIRRSGSDWEHARFDLINILLGDPPKIEWVRDAFPTRRTI